MRSRQGVADGVDDCVLRAHRLPRRPPAAGTETQHILGALDRLRTTFRGKADDLDAAGLQTRIGASALTIGGLLKHVAFVEAYHSLTKLSGRAPGAPWDTVDREAGGDWPFELCRKSAADVQEVVLRGCLGPGQSNDQHPPTSRGRPRPAG
jgi:hypothetical protein